MEYIILASGLFLATAAVIAAKAKAQKQVPVRVRKKD